MFFPGQDSISPLSSPGDGGGLRSWGLLSLLSFKKGYIIHDCTWRGQCNFFSPTICSSEYSALLADLEVKVDPEAREIKKG